MELILLEKVQNLGELGDIVQVKPGYARNFLVPQGKAMLATESAKQKVDERRKELAKLESERLDIAKAKSELLPEHLTVVRKAGDEGSYSGQCLLLMSQNSFRVLIWRFRDQKLICQTAQSKK